MKKLAFCLALVVASPVVAQTGPTTQFPNSAYPNPCTYTAANQCQGVGTGNPLPVTVVSGGGGGGGSTPTGPAGTPNANVVTVQGISGGTVVPVSGAFYQTTQPVSVASGADTVEGATADTASSTTVHGRLIGILARMSDGTQIARTYGVTAGGTQTQLLVGTAGVLAAPSIGTANSTGTVTAVAANTSTTVCPTSTNPVVYEVQIYGAAGVLLGLDGQTLTAVTPAAGSGAYMYLPTQYTLYTGPVARTNAITAYTGTAMTIVCNIVTRP